MRVVDKVGAFVIRRDVDGWRRLLFTHTDFPEAPIQIPGGGLHEGEAPLAGALRELHEEAGVGPLPQIRELGVSELPWQDEMRRRHCFLFDGTGLPDRWQHQVLGNGTDAGLRFDFAWHAIPAGFSLAADLGFFLNPQHIPELYEKS
jgi:8-oxo-dGTP pyrophosphatase MutT (NUDIX family)